MEERRPVKNIFGRLRGLGRRNPSQESENLSDFATVESDPIEEDFYRMHPFLGGFPDPIEEDWKAMHPLRRNSLDIPLEEEGSTASAEAPEENGLPGLKQIDPFFSVAKRKGELRRHPRQKPKPPIPSLYADPEPQDPSDHSKEEDL